MFGIGVWDHDHVFGTIVWDYGRAFGTTVWDQLIGTIVWAMGPAVVWDGTDHLGPYRLGPMHAWDHL